MSTFSITVEIFIYTAYANIIKRMERYNKDRGTKIHPLGTKMVRTTVCVRYTKRMHLRFWNRTDWDPSSRCTIFL